MNLPYLRSAETHEHAAQWTPGGSQTASKAPGRVGPIGAFPLYALRGEGPYLIDADERRYVDWFNSNAAVTLGHAHPHVTQAVERALRDGALLSLPTRLEGEVAERICGVFGMESARFVKTGSEACAAAVRIARMATGRTVVLVPETGYAGWHDWFQASRPKHPGVPDYHHHGIAVFPYNDLSVFECDLMTCGEVALVLLEPCLNTAPTEGYLASVVELAHAHGALVCFDEMICAPRWALGGGTEYFGVQPDLVTGGKGFGNGVPIAFVAGSREVMRHAWAISGTFGGDTLGLAACGTVLDVHQHRGFYPIGLDPIERMWQVGRMLMDHVAGVTARLNLPFAFTGYAVHPVPSWGPQVARERVNGLNSLLQQELAAQGILAHPSGWNASAAHNAEAMELTLTGVERALTVVAAAYHAGAEAEALKGEPIQAAFVARLA